MNDELCFFDEVGLDPPRAAAPRFCPRCRQAVGPSASLCPQCGETTALRGYCPVCESYLLRPPGGFCPKHETRLEESAPAAFPGGQSGPAPRWVTVEVYPDALAAEPPRLRLEAEGIRTFVEGERMGSPMMYPVATGGVKLQVPEPLLADARILLAQTWQPVRTEADDLDDAWDDLAPEPGSAHHSLMEGLALYGTLGVLILSALWAAVQAARFFL